MLKLFKLYRFCIISSHEFLEMIGSTVKKISLQEFSEYRNIILTREQTRRTEIRMFKPLQKMKFQSTFLSQNIIYSNLDCAIRGLSFVKVPDSYLKYFY